MEPSVVPHADEHAYVNSSVMPTVPARPAAMPGPDLASGGAGPAPSGADDAIHAFPEAAGEDVQDARNLVYKGPEFDPSQFFGRFWVADERPRDQGLETLKSFLAHGNEQQKEMAAIFKERASIEETYIKSMTKLHAKAQTVGTACHGSLETAWKRLMEEMHDQASWHTRMAELYRKRIIEPMLSYEKELKKSHKQSVIPVEKAFSQYTDSLAAMLKTKRAAHGKSRDLEAAAAHCDEVARNELGKFTPKDAARAEKSYNKLRDQANEAESNYVLSLGKLQEQREEWETKAISVFKKLQELEFKRIMHFKTLFCDVAHTYEDLLPDIQKTYAECRSATDNINAKETIAAICESQGTGPYVGEKTLYDAYEESSKAVIEPGRRCMRLAEQLSECKKRLNKAISTREGLLRLWDASRNVQSERRSTMSDVFKVKRKIVAHEYDLAAAYSTVRKIRNALLSACNRPPQQHSLSQYLQQYEDKDAIHAILRLPGQWALDDAAIAQEEQVLSAEDATLAAGSGVHMAPGPAAATSYAAHPPATPAPPFPAAAAAAPARPDAGYQPPSAAPPPPPPMQEDAYGVVQNEEDDEDYEDWADGGDDVYGVTGTPIVAAVADNGGAYVGRCRVLYDYAPQADDELQLSENDEVDIVAKIDEQWWEGVLNGAQGVFPSTYVEEI